MTPTISFFVAGIAKPAGSKRGFYIKKLNRVIITDANPNSKDWKSDVKAEAMKAYSGEPLTCPLAVRFDFIVPRPKGHFRTGANSHLLRDSAPKYPTSKPDCDKLSRGVMDALTSIIYKDDAQVVTKRVTKRYGKSPGVNIVLVEESDLT